LALLAAIVVNLAPAVFSDDAPAFGRILGAAPFLVVLPALGLALAFDALRQPPARMILLATVLLAAGWNGYDYFFRFSRQPGLFDAFEVGQWTVLQAGTQDNASGTTFLLLDEAVLAAPAAQLTGRLSPGDRRVVNAQQCLAYPAVTTVPTVLAVLERWRLPLAARLPGANVQLVLHEPEVYPYAAIISLPAGYSAPAEAETAVARLGGVVDLLPVTVPAEPQPAGTRLPITLRWRVAAPLSGRYHFFVHLIGPEQTLLAGADGEPCGGWYSTSVWHAGEIIEHSLTLTLPPELPPGEYDLSAGLYELETGVRLTVDQHGDSHSDQALFGRLLVGPP
jgi:hypothetical protein